MHCACFDRILLDARIPAYMDGARAMGFFSQNRSRFPVHKNHLGKIATDYENWVRERLVLFSPPRNATFCAANIASTSTSSNWNSATTRSFASAVYQLAGQGYRLSIVYWKLSEKPYAPLTAGAIHDCPNDSFLPLHRTTAVDRLYLAVKQALDNLVHEIGLEVAA